MDKLNKILDVVLKFCLAPSDPIKLDSLRLSLGITLILYFAKWWEHAGEWLTSSGYHVSAKVYENVPILPPLNPEFLPWFGIIFWCSLILWTLGWKTKITNWLVLAGVSYVTFVDVLMAYTINKYCVLALICMSLAPAGEYWSISPKKFSRGPSVWPIRVLQSFVIVQYFFAGWNKCFLGGDWLKYPDVLWSQVQGFYVTDFTAWLISVMPKEGWTFMQYDALSFELLSPFLFLIKRLRPIGFVWGLGFQIVVASTMHMLIYFSLQMLCFYLLFFDDKTLHEIRFFILKTFKEIKQELSYSFRWFLT